MHKVLGAAALHAAPGLGLQLMPAQPFATALNLDRGRAALVWKKKPVPLPRGVRMRTTWRRTTSTPVIGYGRWCALAAVAPPQSEPGLGSISMKLHHPVEEFAHGGRLLVEA